MERRAITKTKDFIKGLRIFGILFCFFAVGNILIYFTSPETSRGIYIIVGFIFGGVGAFFLSHALELKRRIKRLQ